MLFLPGASGHGSFWDPVRALIETPSTTLDWPGLGDVPASDEINSYADLVRLVTGHLDRSGPTALIGQSMGGWVAARIAIERPDLVTHLVLCATSAGVDVEALGAIDWRPGARAARPNSPEWSFEHHPPMEDDLATLDIATLLLWADADPISPLAVGQRIDELLPRSELVVYPSTEHWFVHEHVDDVADRIRDHVAQS